MGTYGNKNTNELHYSTVKVTVHGQIFVPIIIRREHHATFTSPTISTMGKKKSFYRYKSGQTCGIKSIHTCLAMYIQTNVGLLCCVSFGHNVAKP